MNFSFLKLKKRIPAKNLSELKQDDLKKIGREQFKKLVERGTDIPVVLL